MRDVTAVQAAQETGPGAVAARRRMPGWVREHRAMAVAADTTCAALAGALALFVRFGEVTPYVFPYVVLSAALPAVWVCVVALNRAYEPRLIGLGSEEFQRILQCGFMLTAAFAVCAYLTKIEVARGYVVLALPLTTLLTLLTRYGLRRSLHRRRARGGCMRRVVAVGHRAAIAELVRRFRRERYHGMEVVAACVPRGGTGDVEGVPVMGDLSDVALAAGRVSADTVAVLACPEMDGVALRRLAWRLEKTDTDLIVAPALMEVAGPRITIRPAAGLPLLHVDHPEISGLRQVLKNLFDRVGPACCWRHCCPCWRGWRWRCGPRGRVPRSSGRRGWVATESSSRSTSSGRCAPTPSAGRSPCPVTAPACSSRSVTIRG